MTSKWIPRDAYEIAVIDRTWHVLVRGGDFYGPNDEPVFRSACTTTDKDEALRIRNVLRTSLETS